MAGSVHSWTNVEEISRKYGPNNVTIHMATIGAFILPSVRATMKSRNLNCEMARCPNSLITTTKKTKLMAHRNFLYSDLYRIQCHRDNQKRMYE